MNEVFQSSNNCCIPQRAGSHFDISISINTYKHKKNMCEPALRKHKHKDSDNAGAVHLSKIKDGGYRSRKIGLFLLLSSRNRRRLLMERQTQKKPRNVWMRDSFTRRIKDTRRLL